MLAVPELAGRTPAASGSASIFRRRWDPAARWCGRRERRAGPSEFAIPEPHAQPIEFNYGRHSIVLPHRAGQNRRQQLRQRSGALRIQSYQRVEPQTEKPAAAGDHDPVRLAIGVNQCPVRDSRSATRSIAAAPASSARSISTGPPWADRDPCCSTGSAEKFTCPSCGNCARNAADARASCPTLRS